jgi:SAM-dependent methyltransferase
MHSSVYEYAERMILKPELITGRHVIEAGSADYNGGLRKQIEALMPASYVGVDPEGGPGVDVEMAFEDYVPERKYDLVVCTEVLEHVHQVHKFVMALKDAAKINGLIFLTTRSPGFPLHGYPEDYWRYTRDDICELFRDQMMVSICEDWKSDHPGIFAIVLRTGPIALINHWPQRIEGPAEAVHEAQP